MNWWPPPLEPLLPPLTLRAIIDILVVTVLIYQFIMIVRGRRAAHILGGIGILLVAYVAAVWAGLDLLRSLLAGLAPYTVFAVIVMFQSEIRRMLARIGRRRWFSFGTRLQEREVLEEIVLAITHLAEKKTGALIVVERDIGLRTFVESGVPLDAYVSSDLLLAVFEHGGTLHDGAVIVQGDRISAAACFLPLSTNPTIMRKLGTRHRAAIGITEETDCVAIAVSEETGTISVAAFGDIETDIPAEDAEARLAKHFRRRAAQALPRNPQARRAQVK